MGKLPAEWLAQAEYDLDTARQILRGGRRFYAAFFCHLAVEKALKGLWLAKVGTEPPRTHNLVYLLGRTGVPAPPEFQAFVEVLNAANVATRYPDDLRRAIAEYTPNKTKGLFTGARRIVSWTAQQL